MKPRATIPVRHDGNLNNEAVQFGQYLIGQTPSQASIDLYIRAVHAFNEPATSHDLKVLSFIRHHPHTIGLIDGGLALTSPHSEVRRRIYTMFAILESMPDYADQFLPKKRSPYYTLYVGYTGVKAIGRACLGILLLKLMVRA